MAKIHDLTDVEPLKFSYKVKNEDGKEDVVELSMDRVFFEIQSKMPTLLSPTGLKLEDGSLETGFSVVMRSFRDGLPTPDDLPTPAVMLDHLRRILRMPEYCPETLVFRLFGLLAQDFRDKIALKKNIADSPASSAPTPAPSTSPAPTPT